MIRCFNSVLLLPNVDTRFSFTWLLHLKYLYREQRHLSFDGRCYAACFVSPVCAGAVMVSGAALFAIIGRTTISPALAGLSISYALSVTQILNWSVPNAFACVTYHYYDHSCRMLQMARVWEACGSNSESLDVVHTDICAHSVTRPISHHDVWHTTMENVTA